MESMFETLKEMKSGMFDMKNEMKNEMGQMRKDNEIRDKSYKALAKQVGQLAEELSNMKRNPGKLPSDTKVNPSHFSSSNVHINQISVSHHKSKGEKSPTPKSLSSVGVDFTGQMGRMGCKNNKSIFFKHNQTDIFKRGMKSEVKTVLNEKLPIKRNDPGAPLITIQMGNCKTRALLDFGAGMSVLPGSLFDKYNFGPLEFLDKTVVLAGLTLRQPRGVVRDVIVKINEFYYPVDFIVLDYEKVDPPQPQNVILGRPLLSTANAIIDCLGGTVNLTFGDKKMQLNVLTNNNKSLGADLCMIDVVNQNKKKVKKKKRKGRVCSCVVKQVPNSHGERKKEEVMVVCNEKPYGAEFVESSHTCLTTSVGEWGWKVP